MDNQFSSILKGKVVIVGIGNILCADDRVGPMLVGHLEEKTKAVCIDAGTSPETYIGKIAKENPDTVLIVDAVHLGRAPGEYGIFAKEDIAKSGFTTHDMSPHLFIDFLHDQTRAAIYMLGIQPKSVSLGEKMSAEVRQALKNIEAVLVAALQEE